MFKKLSFIFLAMLVSILSYANVVLTYNETTKKIVPSEVGLAGQIYPVFVFHMPCGYTDFELKATVTNFNGGNVHDGTELIFYYNSNYPYIGTTGAAPLQEFNIKLTKVWVSVSESSTHSDHDSRVLIPHSNNGNTVINSGNNRYSIQAKTTGGGKVGGVVMIIGYDSSNTDLANNLNPTNLNLSWMIVFRNSNGAERDANGNYIWRPIAPAYWTYSTDLFNNNNYKQ